jgi:ABC-type glutathione transport system ATPase component
MQIIFQDPVSSLNPRMTVGNIIGEPIEVHGIARGASAKNEMVAAAPARRPRPQSYAAATPRILRRPAPAHRHRPRAGSEPDFIVCDEPVSALDVSIQSQILNLLDDLQRERNIAYLFIAHNLAVVEHFSDEVAVMYLGRIVEKASSRRAVQKPEAPLHDVAAERRPRARPAPQAARASSSKAKCRRRATRRPAARSTRAAR